jgi:AraC-like DNA-binding protein
MQDIHISNGYIQLWASYLKKQQIEPLSAEFLKDLHSQLGNLIDQPFDAEVPLTLLMDVLERTAQHLHCPRLIFDIVQEIRPEHFGVLGYMASKSSTLAEIIRYIMRFQRLVIDGHEFVPVQFKQNANNIELYWGFIHEKYNLLNELTMAAMVQLGRDILDAQPFVLQSVSFAHAASMAPQHYQKFYAAEVRFQQKNYVLKIDIRKLNLQLDHRDPMLLQLLVRQAEEKIAAKQATDTIIQRAEKIIAETLRVEQRAIKIEQLAAQLYLSIRSLQREYAAQGSSFKKILEQERIKRCDILLQHGSSLSDIAEQLDYSDQSALARAYKAATGQTLVTRRKQLQQP